MNSTFAGIAILPLIVGCVQVAKQSGLPGKLAPLASLILGVLCGVGLQYASGTGGAAFPSGPVIVTGLVTGVALGLAASGFYSHVQSYIAPPTMNGVATPLPKPKTASPTDFVPLATPAEPTAT